MSVLTTNPPLSRIDWRQPFRDDPILAGGAVIMALMTAQTLVAMALDARLFQGDSVWLKPLKFDIALTLYLGTLAVYARWLPRGMTRTPGYRVFAWTVIAAIAGEILWIKGAAVFGVASHFNESTVMMATVYSVMGVLAVTLTTASTVYGVAILRNPATGLSDAMRHAVGWGLILTLPLTFVTAGMLAGNGGHFVGTPVLGEALPVLGWSREVGDLRVAHFFATHAMHALPLAALVLPPKRQVIWLSAAAYSAFVAAVFLQALDGRPFLAL